MTLRNQFVLIKKIPIVWTWFVTGSYVHNCVGSLNRFPFSPYLSIKVSTLKNNDISDKNMSWIKHGGCQQQH